MLGGRCYQRVPSRQGFDPWKEKAEDEACRWTVGGREGNVLYTLQDIVKRWLFAEVRENNYLDFSRF